MEHDTPADSPLAISEQLREVNSRLDRLEKASQALFVELTGHKRAEIAARVVHGSLPWLAMIVSLAALAVSVYRMGEPVVVQVHQLDQPVVWR